MSSMKERNNIQQETQLMQQHEQRDSEDYD
jgi:hypothetical protein